MTGLGQFPSARVRIYRQGLGDCFLVTLPRAGGRGFNLLIDCGVLPGTPDAAAVMTRVARDVAAVSGGHLDVVAVSHEHWDHVSGFLQARAVFDTLTIGEVWLPWTEDPADPRAGELRKARRRALRGLRKVAALLAAEDAEAAGRLRGPLGLFGAASGPDGQVALEYLLAHPSRPRVRYLAAGGPPRVLGEGVGGCVHVLGPAASGGGVAAGHEPTALAPGLALFAAADGLGADGDELAERSQAFSPRYRVPAGQARALPFFRDRYLARADEWRRIETDWLGGAEQLTLALDSAANDSSLVLAVELEPGGRVLLFPGDAQAGCWRSWQAYRWERVCGTDLLSRTVLYKVSHHGSDGGTPREAGLELLSDRGLVALVTVCRAAAARMGWMLPFGPLLERLRQKTRGRVLLTDEGLPERPADFTEADWDDFIGRVTVDTDGLYVEYAV